MSLFKIQPEAANLLAVVKVRSALVQKGVHLTENYCIF